jgi:mRNA-degrading endonuclease RelE of RelBE toxin-antitoxin system
MIFVETEIFTRRVLALLADDDYRALQVALLIRPEQGPVIVGSGGLRKVRWSRGHEGKRGGLRVIYYWDDRRHVIYMLFLSRKSRRDDLTRDQLRVLAAVVRREFR